jgi:hypothetical protein
MTGLKEHSRILLYGRVAEDLELKNTDASAADTGSAMGSGGLTQGKNRKFVNIYGFEFEGHYYDLPKPAILLVSGEAQSPSDAKAVVKPEPKLQEDIQVWNLDKDDLSVRLDVTSGPLEDILLEQAVSDSGMAAQTSAKRVSGKRMSGD